MSLKEHRAFQGSLQRMDWAGFSYCDDEMQVFDLTISGAVQEPTSDEEIPNPDNSLQILENACDNKTRKYNDSAVSYNIDFMPTGKLPRSVAKFFSWLCYVAIPGICCQRSKASGMY